MNWTKPKCFSFWQELRAVGSIEPVTSKPESSRKFLLRWLRNSPHIWKKHWDSVSPWKQIDLGAEPLESCQDLFFLPFCLILLPFYLDQSACILIDSCHWQIFIDHPVFARDCYKHLLITISSKFWIISKFWTAQNFEQSAQNYSLIGVLKNLQNKYVKDTAC